ncbi:MAG TPA: molybdopterin cofactor-binding domain-containing protein [Chitinophagaceae bacterium]|nr:molybdopterin cofactor-binding domain-containing protein [Chitinophagaceae bacterium]
MSSKRPAISRRHFIRQTGISGIALTIGICLPAHGGIGEIINLASQDPDTMGAELMSWISIDTTGTVTILNHRSEMGQGTFQSIPQMIAEELEVGMDQVQVQSVAANPKKFGPQPQEGSYTVRGWYKQLLRVGATAREMLIAAAAAELNVPATECYAMHGEVIHRPSGKKLGYGDLAQAASKLAPPPNPPLKQRKDYTIIGKPLKRKDTACKINGAAVFGMDKKLPGMLYAVVERSPRFCGKVKRFDDSATLMVPGVKQVFTVQRAVHDKLYEGVAVVADTRWAAMQGRKHLVVEWDDTGFEHLDTAQLYARMQEGLGKSIPSTPFEKAFQTAEKKIEAIYETPYQSHSCMEPLNCIAHVQDNRIDIWGPIQEANWIQRDLAGRMNIPVENITVNMTFLGGGFGRKAFTDYPHEAAFISRHIKAPVQVFWTREDDMRSGPFRPGAMYACRGGLAKDGSIHAFQASMATQYFGQDGGGKPEAATSNSGHMEGLPEPYLISIPHYSFAGYGIASPIPTMWWRSVYASTNSFATESFIDELSHAAGQDPFDFRRTHLRTDRYQALINQLEKLSLWKTRGKNQGWGVAITECFGSIVGHVVKVSRKPDGKIKIDKVTALMDCGWYVNPAIIRAQVEGSIVMGLGAAIKHATHFHEGMAVETNFHHYDMPRISDIPAIEVHIMENAEDAGGVGEPGLPPLAPALCNAIFDLTGKRIRKLPFLMDEV